MTQNADWVGVVPSPPTPEPTYTLEEAREKIAKLSCAQHGHDFEHIVNMMGDLLMLNCGRCGRTWRTEER